MDEKEKNILEQSLKLSRENNLILKKLESRANWAIAWSLLKISLVVTPIIIGFLFIEPYFDNIKIFFESLNKLINP